MQYHYFHCPYPLLTALSPSLCNNPNCISYCIYYLYFSIVEYVHSARNCAPYPLFLHYLLYDVILLCLCTKEGATLNLIVHVYSYNKRQSILWRHCKSLVVLPRHYAVIIWSFLCVLDNRLPDRKATVCQVRELCLLSPLFFL